MNRNIDTASLVRRIGAALACAILAAVLLFVVGNEVWGVTILAWVILAAVVLLLAALPVVYLGKLIRILSRRTDTRQASAGSPKAAHKD